MKKIIVHHRSSHHSGYSGYAQLIDYMDDVEVIYGKNSILSERVARFIKKRNSQQFGLYDSNSAHKNIELINKLLFSKEKYVVHYLNGERDIRQAINCFKKVTSVATFHKPPEVLKKTILDTQYLKKLNGAIAVGENQVDFLKNWLDNENVKYIPHGVDTDFFTPDNLIKKENTILFVGQHLRDFEALNYAVPRLMEQNSKLKLKVIIRKDFKNKITPHSSIEFFSDLDDYDLRILYQEASILFLPLKNVTACNSILEAMACGLPIISTDVGGNNKYINNKSGILVPSNDNIALVDSVKLLLNNKDLLNEMSVQARINAMEFQWHKVASNVEQFYRTL